MSELLNKDFQLNRYLHAHVCKACAKSYEKSNFLNFYSIFYGKDSFI